MLMGLLFGMFILTYLKTDFVKLNFNQYKKFWKIILVPESTFPSVCFSPFVTCIFFYLYFIGHAS